MDFTKKNIITGADLTKLEIIDVNFNFKGESVQIVYKEMSSDKGTQGRAFTEVLYGDDFTALAACLNDTKFKKYLNDNKLWEKYDLKMGESPTTQLNS